jgi:Zn-dependent peptidase ImmA (M78 family)
MFIPDIAIEKIPNWGEQMLLEDKALEFCGKHKIYIVEDARQKFGKLKFYKGYVFILINPKLNLAMRLWVLWHEIGHFCLHEPVTASFSKSTKRKHDREANYVAAVALIPLSVIMFQTPEEIQEQYGYPTELIQIRLDICRKEKI